MANFRTAKIQTQTLISRFPIFKRFLTLILYTIQKELKCFIQLLVTISHCKADDLVSQMYFIILLVDGTPCLKENNSTGKVHFLSDSGY